MRDIMATLSQKKVLDRRLEAENVTLLKHLLGMELRRLKDEMGCDMIFFMGVDGRTFSSQVPFQLNTKQFYLFNLLKGNLPHLCDQLAAENLRIAIEQYKEGTFLISGVGDSAFMAMAFTRPILPTDFQKLINGAIKGSTVIKHIMELKPIKEEILKQYPKEVGDELRKLSRLLFVERFDQTKQYKKNTEILDFIKKKLSQVVGVGAVDEIITVTFNELGTSAPYMTDQLWRIFLEKVIRSHVKRISGDIMADECYRTWMPELDEKLKSFV